MSGPVASLVTAATAAELITDVLVARMYKLFSEISADQKTETK